MLRPLLLTSSQPGHHGQFSLDSLAEPVLRVSKDHGTHGLLDGNGRIDARQTVDIEDIDAETLEAVLACLCQVVGLPWPDSTSLRSGLRMVPDLQWITIRSRRPLMALAMTFWLCPEP